MHDKTSPRSGTLRVLEDDDPTAHVPPGSRLPATVQSLQWFRDPVRFMERTRARHGKSFSVKLGPLSRCSFIGDAPVAWQVLTGDPVLMRMGSTNGIFRPVLGDRSLFLLDGEQHKHHQSLIRPAFYRPAIKRYGDLVRELGAREVATWPVGTAFAAQERMRGVTMHVIFRAVLGIVDPRRDEQIRELIHGLLDHVQNPIAVLPQFQVELGGRSPFAKLMAIVAKIDTLLYEEIGARRYDPSRSDRDDVLSMLVGPRVHEPGYMSDREIRDELLTLLIAGHETTATALSWAFERLLRHPDAVAACRAEIEAGNGDAYIDAVVRETLRQRPVLPITARKLTEPVSIGEWTFPKGWTLMPCMYLVHNDPDVYPEPERFRPERFLEGDGPSSRVWLPFGAGPRHCIGSALAMMAVKVILRTVLERAEIEPDRAEPEQIVRRNFTLGPSRGARIVVRRRLEPRVAVKASDAGGPLL
jgi:cytochrome P450